MSSTDNHGLGIKENGAAAEMAKMRNDATADHHSWAISLNRSRNLAFSALFVSVAALAVFAAACGDTDDDADSGAVDTDGGADTNGGAADGEAEVSDGGGGGETTTTAVTGGSPDTSESSDASAAPEESEQKTDVVSSPVGDAPDVPVGDVPDMQMTDVISNEAVNLRSLVDGQKPILLWFWAPYCPICRGEAPGLEEFAQANSHRLKVVGLGTDNDLDYAQRFVADTGTTFTMLWSDSSDVWQHYGVTANSSFWLLDSEGRRIGEAPKPYNQGLVEELLDSLT